MVLHLHILILSGFKGVGFPREYDSNDLVPAPIAVTNQQQADHGAEPQEDEALFIVRMLRVGDHQGIAVIKDRLSFLEGYAMLLFIDLIFAFVPLKLQHPGRIPLRLIQLDYSMVLALCKGFRSTTAMDTQKLSAVRSFAPRLIYLALLGKLWDDNAFRPLCVRPPPSAKETV